MNAILVILSASLADWNNWRWQLKQKATCSNLRLLAALGFVAQGFSQSRCVGLTPYNVKLLLDLQKSNSEGFQAEMLQSFLPPGGKNKKHQWVWAKRHDLLWSRVWSLLPLPRCLKTLFGGRGSDTEIKGMEKMYPEIDVVMGATVCARHCSFCFREVGDAQGEAARIGGGMDVVMNAVKEVIARKTPHVLITGGDPLTRSNEQLRQIMEPLVQSQTVQVLRLATRMVVDLPMRFYDQELLAMLKDFAQQMKQRHASLRIVTQVNHVCELTDEAVKALENIQACGIEVISQTTSLKGVNDAPEKLQELFMKLDRLGVRNHHLFHSMPVAGTGHLQVPYRKFRKLLASVYQWLPTTAVPHAVVATLIGKMPIAPSGRWVLSIPFTNRLLCRSFRGELYLFKDAWDVSRHLREASVAAVVVILLMGISLLVKPSQQIVCQTEKLQTTEIKQVVDYSDKRRGYVDSWAWNFAPFVKNETLYIPMFGLRR